MRKSLLISGILLAVAVAFTYYINKKVKIKSGEKIVIAKTTKLEDVPMLEGVGQISTKYYYPRGWGHCRLEKGGTLSVIKAGLTWLDVVYTEQNGNQTRLIQNV